MAIRRGFGLCCYGTVGSGLACLGQASYDAQYNLGLLYQNGQGMPQDMV
jgi:TPR repeat protein